MTYNLFTILLAICHVESGTVHNAINVKDGKSASYGSCQIKYSTAKHLGFKGHITDLWLNQEINQEYAYKYFLWQVKRYKGDIKKAIAAYNMGSVKYKNGKFVNQKYVDKVLKEIK